MKQQNKLLIISILLVIVIAFALVLYALSRAGDSCDDPAATGSMGSDCNLVL